ncbi:MAG TPA: glycosyltransferase family 4 protein [Solirubrobacterales bacterium]
MKIALYGEVNMNLLDGSSVWMQSMTQMLTSLPDVQVTLLLRCAEERQVLTAPLHSDPRTELIDPGAWQNPQRRLSAAEAVDGLQALDAERGFDIVLLRGAEVTAEACRRSAFTGRLWIYHLSESRPGAEAEHLHRVGACADRILCQTDAILALAEAAAPEHAGKLTLLPPMIPAPATSDPVPGAERDGPLRLIYAGKFAPEYEFIEMLETFKRLRRSDPESELHLVGDKIHNPPDDPTFKSRAEAALSETENIVWHGGVSRNQVAELLREADVALSVRHPKMSRSKELSTKVLEYGAAGCAVVLNRTPLYEELLGADYPLFASGPSDTLAALQLVREDPAVQEMAADRCRTAAEGFTFERVAANLEPYLRGPTPRIRVSAGDRTPRILIAGHDFKFLSEIPDRANALGAEIREDKWTSLNQHDPEASEELLDWADLVLCEWCLGNSVWYSHHVRDDQRLVIRFHRVERTTDFPESVDFDRVARAVFVGPHLLDEAVDRYSWPREKLRLVPNAVNLRAMRREKLPGSSFNLGMIGFVPAIKRIDRALDVLELLRARDRRFRLIVKGKPPWEFPWMRKRDEERRMFQEAYQRIDSAPLLRGAVTFEEFGPNIPAFLRKIGIIVSTSDYEGHQVAVAEGMASACVPVILDRPGARQQYDASWVHDSPEEAAAAVLGLVETGEFEAEQRRAGEFAERWSLERIMPLWDEVLGLSDGSGEPAPDTAVSIAT